MTKLTLQHSNNVRGWRSHTGCDKVRFHCFRKHGKHANYDNEMGVIGMDVTLQFFYNVLTDSFSDCKNDSYYG